MLILLSVIYISGSQRAHGFNYGCSKLNMLLGRVFGYECEQLQQQQRLLQRQQQQVECELRSPCSRLNLFKNEEISKKLK